MLRAMGLRPWSPPGPLSPPTALAPTTSAAAADSCEQVLPQLESATHQAAPQSEKGATWRDTPRASQAASVVDSDWPQLRQAVTQCRACGLCEGRTQTVFGAGPARAHWLVIGEAPGAQEDAQGEPFVGASGQLLEQMLRAIGLSRAGSDDASKSVFSTNTVKCRPPGNRNPLAEEMAQCEPFLLRQIELLQPRMILAMGRFAAQALLRSTEPIGRLRGQLHSYHGVPMVVTYHPAYLLRNLNEKAKAWEDLCLAADSFDANR